MAAGEGFMRWDAAAGPAAAKNDKARPTDCPGRAAWAPQGRRTR